MFASFQILTNYSLIALSSRREVWEVEVYVHAFLISVLITGEWTASRHITLFPNKDLPVISEHTDGCAPHQFGHNGNEQYTSEPRKSG